MQALSPLIEQILINALVTRKAPAAGKRRLGLGLMVLSGFFLAAALVFCLLAGYGWLLNHYAQPLAALIAAVIAAVICLFIALCGLLLFKKTRPAITVEEKDVKEFATLLADTIGGDFAQSVRENPKTALLLAGATGFVTGRRFN